MNVRFDDDMTLGEARDIFRELVRDGHHCPLCSQYSKVYRRKLNSGMAVSLVRMWHKRGTDWIISLQNFLHAHVRKGSYATGVWSKRSLRYVMMVDMLAIGVSG